MRVLKLVPVLALAVFSHLALALDLVPYTPAEFAKLQQEGKPVALHFHADWCPTCRAQTKVFDKFKAAGELPMTILVVDYDTEKALERKLGVRTQSTLIIYDGKMETDRIVGITDPMALREALQSAL